MLAPPIGFIPLKIALDLVRAKLPPQADAERSIAEACHAGRLKAAYRSWTGGADEMDNRIWERPHWRSFFEKGEVELILPLLDESNRPDPSGFTSRCNREIFITNESLTPFLAAIPPRPSADAPKARRGPKSGIQDRVVAEMQQDVMVGKITVDSLRAEAEKELVARYRASRDTVRKARIAAISGGVSKPPGK
ncbi:hypothetical protein [Bradyrhizobium sp. WSM2793]|uniref:hypothetical protein n=1 Tax=Bradyrhizobium sp. WSM2793 TaxID=1038866 RepID=UPI0003762A2C|nr:hypothetical protein [Bradyrhizobium sp. WSM2793]